jgi:multisubunit Na+/H+ antiporter MnhB subunit
MAESVLDLLIALTLVYLGWRIIVTQSDFRAAVQFMALGLVSALAWVRLSAIDIALAEAVLGAGITGALLLDAMADLRRGERRLRGWRLHGPVLIALLLAIPIAMAFLAPGATGLAEKIQAAWPDEGIGNATTLVLLDFRALDTILELAVMLVALAGCYALLPTSPRPDRGLQPLGADAGLPAKWIALFMVLAAAYLLWLGTHRAGGAFQAGALLAAAGMLLVYIGRLRPAVAESRWLKLAAIAGVGGFLFVGLIISGLSGAIMGYPADGQVLFVLLIEVAIALGTAATLIALFLAARAAGGEAAQ